MITKYRKVRAARSSATEGGFTLVEVLVYMVIFLMVVAMVATIMIKMMHVQRDVTGSAHQNMDQQSVYSDISRVVRNSISMEVKFGGQLLVGESFIGDLDAVVGVRPGSAGNINDPGNWNCRAWLYDAENDVLYQTYDPERAASAYQQVATLGDVLSAARAGVGWREVLTGVTPANGQIMFSIIKADPVGSPEATLEGNSIFFNNAEGSTEDRIWVSIIGETVAPHIDQYQIKFDTQISLRNNGSGASACSV